MVKRREKITTSDYLICLKFSYPKHTFLKVGANEQPVDGRYDIHEYLFLKIVLPRQIGLLPSKKGVRVGVRVNPYPNPYPSRHVH